MTSVIRKAINLSIFFIIKKVNHSCDTSQVHQQLFSAFARSYTLYRYQHRLVLPLLTLPLWFGLIVACGFRQIYPRFCVHLAPISGTFFRFCLCNQFLWNISQADVNNNHIALALFSCLRLYFSMSKWVTASKWVRNSIRLSTQSV